MPDNMRGDRLVIKRRESHAPLLFLHGFLGNRHDWNDVISNVISPHETITVDLPGHGERSDADIPSYPELIKELHDWIQMRGLASVHLIGYSMGGRIALSYALRYPGMLSSLSMISSSPGVENKRERFDRKKRDDEWAEKISSLSTSDFLEQWYSQPVFSRLQTLPELKMRLIKERKGVNREAMAKVLRLWGQGTVPSEWSAIKDVSCPFLWVAGRDDSTYAGMRDAISRLHPDVRTIMLDQAGHAVHLEKPREVGQALHDFVQSINLEVE